MEKNNFKINQEEMLKYYERFDPIEKKYRKCFIQCKNKKDKLYKTFYQYESNRQFSDLTKKEFGDIYANLNLVYADNALAQRIIEIYDLIYDKIINQYLNIDGMERLFSENYINFEWEMHLGIDYAGHSMKFYRDHFIHQVRDAYSMDVLLEQGYAEEIMKILGDDGTSKISRYVCKHINQQLERRDEIFKDEEKEKKEEYRREFYLENIVYMSSYMSALFHDIGYPEVANIQSGKNILAYIANVYNFGSGHIDFDRIIAVLQNSLLFRVVHPKEIRKRIENDKIDHGVVSALMFLLHFYENGAIYGLEPYKKCAIELAGLSIYNHTNSYANTLKESEAEEAVYQKCVFVLNPISYLLRICDDLQEWDRIYFEISPNANIIFCNTCHTPIIRKNWEGQKDVYYLCNCNKKENIQLSGVFGTIFQRYNFPYRRLYNVTVCTELRIKKYDKDKKQIFELDYNLERLLNVAYINPSYAKYRIKELNQLKKMFIGQDMQQMIYIKYFMSANVLLIKSYIMGEYLKRNSKENRFRLGTHVKYVLDMAEAENKDLHERIMLHSKYIYNKIKSSLEITAARFSVKVLNYLDENFVIYVYLYFVMRLGKFGNEKNNKEKRKKIDENIEKLWENFEAEEQFTSDTLYLINDCCKQATRMYEEGDLLSYDIYPEKYFKQFASDKGIENCFLKFVHADNYLPVSQKESYGRNIYELDAYTDLYLFRQILHNLGY